MQNRKEHNQFYKSSKRPDGLDPTCKQCKKSYYLKNKEKRLVYYHSTKDDRAKTNKIWRDNNKDLLAEYIKKYQQKNKSMFSNNSAKRRAKKLQATPEWSEKDLIKKIYDESDRLTNETGIQYNVDHIVPLQSDYVCGLHVLSNLQIITAYDNSSKNNRSWPDM